MEIKSNSKYNFSNKALVGCILIAGTTIGCFAVLRFLSGDTALATIDAAIALTLLIAGYNAKKVKNSKKLIYLITILAVIAILAVQYVSGTGKYWTYVIAAAVFYIFPYRHAIVLAGTPALGICMLLWVDRNYDDILPFLTTAILSGLFSFLFALSLERKNNELKLLSLQDEMTGIGNRRALDQKINEMIKQHNRLALPASLIYFDVDNFKSINDTMGHTSGDLALIRIAELTTRSLRETDSVFRVGGDEFIIIIEGANQSAASLVAEKLRESIQSSEIIPSRTLTISLGLSVIEKDDTPDSWISRADSNLYQAKESGKNRIGHVS